MLTECKGEEIPSCRRNPRESGAELWVVQSPEVGGGQGDGDPRSLGEGTGHQGISVETVRRRWSARADPLWEVKCGALGSCGASSHPADKRRKELANASRQRWWIPVTRVCISHSFKYLLIYGRAGSSFSRAGLLQWRRAGLSVSELCEGHTAWLLLQSTGGLQARRLQQVQRTD